MDDYEALKQAVVAFLRVPTNVTRSKLAKLVGEPYDEPSPPGSYKAARGVLRDDDGLEETRKLIERWNLYDI